MGMKQIIPALVAGAAIAATGGLAAPALAAGGAGAAGAGAAGAAGAGGLLGAASGMTGTALGGLGAGLGAGATTAATEGLLAPMIVEGVAPVASALPSFAEVGGLSSIATGAAPMTALDSAALTAGTTGLSSSLIPTMNLANSTGAASSSMFGNLKDYATLDNLKGAAMVANQFQPAPQTMPQSGNIKVGQAPTGDIYDELRKYGYTLPKRRETNFSLLG
jgi:hypothetical protein